MVILLVVYYIHIGITDGINLGDLSITLKELTDVIMNDFKTISNSQS